MPGAYRQDGDRRFPGGRAHLVIAFFDASALIYLIESTEPSVSRRRNQLARIAILSCVLGGIFSVDRMPFAA